MKTRTKCRLTGIVTDYHAVSGIMGEVWTQKLILLQNVGIRRAFWQVGIAPDRAATLAYRLRDLVIEDLRLQFGT